MTKTYNDIEAVTRLLEEKEKDIELTARIGKELLAHNSKLESNVASLENELRLCNDKITQLSHELLKKNELIQILTNDVEDSGSEAGTPTSGKPGSAHFDILQRRIGMLENENAGLRAEASRLAAETEDTEEQEARLVADLVAQLDACRTDLGNRGLEAERNRFREHELKEQIEHLQAKLQTSNEKLSETMKQNEEYLAMLTLSRETQCELATELADLKEKYAEVVSVLEELRENMRKSKKKNQPTARAGPLYPSLHTSVQIKNPDSLAAELECSLFSELSLDSGIGGASTSNIPNYKKVFETVRCASRASSLNSGGEPSSTSSPAPRLGGTCITPSSAFASTSSRPRTSSYIPMPYDTSSVSDSEEITIVGKGLPNLGSGGTSENLELALKRLTPATIDARRSAMDNALAGMSPLNFDIECPTPDSIMSAGSSNYTPWKLPDKLQIVKPLEGSLTLHHWSELATPSLGGLLEERPGVKIRGGTELEDLGLQMYSLCDVEEDDDINPGKSFQDTSHIYTYTNSTVMHPDDNTNVTSSIQGSQMCISATSSRVSSICPTPAMRSRRNSTSTFSTTPGLAALLNERGIRAVTPSALASPQYSPTATPCNSPVRASSPDQDDYPSLGLPGFLMTSGAEMLRRALSSAIKSPTAVRSNVLGSTPSGKSPTALARPDKKAALTGIRLVEKLERIGIEEILATTTASSSVGGGTTLHQAAIKRTPLKSQKGSGILGVPGRPGRGELEARLSQLPAGGGGGRRGGGRLMAGERQVRPDLGHVPGQAPNNVRQVQSQPQPQPQPPQSPTAPTTLGTLSSLLFGRKGGLL